MENTQKLLLEEDPKARWFVAVGETMMGPLTAADIYEKIRAGELTWAHYGWRNGQADWQRLCDIPVFRAAVPLAPVVKKAKRSKPVAAPPRPAVQAKIWYLHHDDTQFGPFSSEEVSRLIQVGRVSPGAYAWKEGMEDWRRLEKIPEFAPVSREAKGPKLPAPPSRAREQRGSPRRPLVARILVASDESVIVGVCRDISVGGMQVLTEKVPGKVGSRIRLNVSPSGKGQSGVLGPFVAEGVIVRILEDGRGFSFRFERLPESAREAIERHISA